MLRKSEQGGISSMQGTVEFQPPTPLEDPPQGFTVNPPPSFHHLGLTED